MLTEKNSLYVGETLKIHSVATFSDLSRDTKFTKHYASLKKGKKNCHPYLKVLGFPLQGCMDLIKLLLYMLHNPKKEKDKEKVAQLLG